MGTRFFKAVEKVIQEADILLYLLDARFPNKRNRQVEGLIREKKKQIIFVFTKYDLVADRNFPIPDLKSPFVLVSATTYYGMGKLKERLIIECRRLNKKVPKVGVLGYPNIGKSSLINALKGTASASISPEPGHTKGKQYLWTKHFMLIDSPGVIPYSEEEEPAHVLMGALPISNEQVEPAAFEIIKKHPKSVENAFTISVTRDVQETLERIAFAKKLLLSGGRPDTLRAAQMLVKLFQKGKLGR